MSWTRWWKQTPTVPMLDAAHLPMSGWQLVQSDSSSAAWRDSTGDVISLALSAKLAAMPIADMGAAQDLCRSIAESQHAGLVEVRTATGGEGPALIYVYKRLEIPKFKVFGVINIPKRGYTVVWMVLAGEHGVSGVREALIAKRLFEADQLSFENYEERWAQDPYDPTYRGVDRSTLRYLSDAEEYDADFPDHPLTKVRRELKRLLNISLAYGPPA